MKLEQPKRRLAFVAIVALLSVAASSFAQQAAEEAPSQASPLDTWIVAKDLAAHGNVPLSTVLTDLITKNATVSIESGLGLTEGERLVWRDPHGRTTLDYGARFGVDEGSTLQEAVPAVPSSNSRTEYLDARSAETEQAVRRGYTPRTIEFDPRFQLNVSRLAADVLDNPNAVLNARIWGGTPVTAESDIYPDAVAIHGNGGFCSGTVIAPDKVLTAAHCYCDGVTDEVLIGQNTSTPSEKVPVDREGSDVFTPCDVIKTNLKDGDIALLKLSWPVSVPPRALTSLQTVRDAASVRAVGFGRTQTDIGFKYQINIVIASFQCDGVTLTGIPDSQVFRCKPVHELVAAGLNRDTCAGDSGGPVYVLGPDGKIYLAGVTSRAVDPLGRCGPGGIYALPAAPPLRAWLEARGISIP